MIGDYEDDAHFCLKCHATIIGLDNYVTHRKAGCPPKPLELPKSLLPTDDAFDALKADDFFLSLELQSSTKKVAATPSTSGGKVGILTRSKTSGGTKLQPQPSKSGKNAWIGGHQLKELGTGDNQTKLIKAVDNLSRSTYLKPPDVGIYNASDNDNESEEMEYDEEEFEDEEDVPPRSYTGGKWMPQWNQPPQNFTGGKWKPQLNQGKGKWKPASPVTNFPAPAASFTGSKWTPTKARQLEQLPAHRPSQYQPPITHTKGKWKPQLEERRKRRTNKVESPPFRKSSGSIQYWCGPCNRRLASKIVYDRHLRSVLHRKRASQDDSDFDDNIQPVRKTAPVTAPAAAVPVEYNSRPEEAVKRHRRRTYWRCGVCRARINTRTIGKHLISHYHCRKGDITQPEAQKMVLDNIHDIVLQSPYQCGTCKFYCNTHATFLTHWRSLEHRHMITKSNAVIICVFCKFTTPRNSEMLSHLSSPEHAEIIAAINRSVPIIIKTIKPITCGTCSTTFLLNVQMRKHCDKENHKPATTATNEYQTRKVCKFCKAIFKSHKAYQCHLLRIHNSKLYFCTPCDQLFDTAEDVKEHRKTREHFHNLPKDGEDKKCPHCDKTFAQFLLLKSHLKHVHPDKNYKCAMCNKQFVMSQDLGAHVRANMCQVVAIKGANECPECPYSCDRESDLVYHKALHGVAIDGNYGCPLCDKVMSRRALLYHVRDHLGDKDFGCELCDARFSRESALKMHVKTHRDGVVVVRGDKEMSGAAFLCAICGQNFPKNAALLKHMQIHTGKKFPCGQPNCPFAARTAGELRTHMSTTHSDVRNHKCEHCEYKSKTKSQLRRHMMMHDNSAQKYKCRHCSFTTRLGYHLRRHELVHTGAKPYNCPHCDYSCNNLENLRKHVLSTKKHPGKTIYECKFCSQKFRTNFAKDFQVHLVREHGNIFGSGTEAASFIADVHERERETKTAPASAVAGSSHNNDEVVHKQEEDEEEVDNPSQLIEVAFGGGKAEEELFPMYIIAKDEVVCVDKSTWDIVTYEEDEEAVQNSMVEVNGVEETFFKEDF